MFVFIFTVWVALHDKDGRVLHALVYAYNLPEAEALLRRDEGVVGYETTPVAVFYDTSLVDHGKVILERNHFTQGGQYHG